MTFKQGTGVKNFSPLCLPEKSAKYLQRGIFLSAAPALAIARDTASIALAPIFPFCQPYQFYVPSRIIYIYSSIFYYLRTDQPIRAGFIILLILLTALRTPFPLKRFGSSSRSSTASQIPVDAPDGTQYYYYYSCSEDSF